jgi:protein phosphatase
VRTDTGKVRSHNEDASGFFPESAFYIVADGMGGHLGGEVASALAVETMAHSLEETKEEDLTPLMTPEGTSVAGRRLFLAVQEANNIIFAKSNQDPSLAGMGTTVAAVLFDGRENVASICHVGDSRVYRIRDGHLECLTEDHSLVRQLLREGKIGPQELKTFPGRNVLTQAVGVSPLVQPVVRLERPQPGDLFLLCSDGVHGMVDEPDMLDIVLREQPDLQKACDTIVALANAHGGSDNSTVIILSYSEDASVL